MKRAVALLGVLALLLFVVPAAGNHDPIHTACQTWATQLHSALHGPGGAKGQRNATEAVWHNTTGATCRSAGGPPPPPMPQGSSLRAKHVWDIGANYYVDSANGNDSTGDGSSGAPWKTLQTVFTKLTDGTVTWPTSAPKDVAINIRPTAAYKATSGSVTLDIFFSNSSRAPASDRYLIWRKDPAYSTRPVIHNPDGTTGFKGAIQVGSNALNSYQIFSGLDLDGEAVGKGTGNGGSMGLYLSGTAANSNTRIELLDTKIHDFWVGTPGANNQAQAMFIDTGASFFLVDQVESYDISNGADAAEDPFAQHGAYIQSADVQITNSSFHDNPNGYGIQFYNGGSATFPRAVVANTTLHNNYASGILIHGDEDDVKFRNLIITDHTGRGAESFGIEFYPNPSGGSTGCSLDHVVYNGNQGGTREANAQWTFTNETSADPLYVGSNDLHLQSGSPALGYTDTAYSFAYDLDGTARPADDEDAGAYEFSSAGRHWVWR